MAYALIGLGANLGPRQQTLEEAVGALVATPGIRLLRRARWRETAAVGGPPQQPAFLNGALLVETSLSPQELAAVLGRIEAAAGRQREQRWQARTLDLDLLLYDQQVIQTDRLSVPHPRMVCRRFVLEPAAEIAGEMVHPPSGWTVSRLWEHLVTAMPYLVIAAIDPPQGQLLAARLAQRSGARLLDWARLPSAGEIAGATLSGRLHQAAVEFLVAACVSLDRGGWPADDRWTVSGCWLRQAACLAHCAQPGEVDEAQGGVPQLIEAVEPFVVAPKLRVLYEGTAAALSASDQSDSQPLAIGPAFDQLESPRFEQWRQAVIRAATQPHTGPWLNLSAADLELAVDELAAAIEGMQ